MRTPVQTRVVVVVEMLVVMAVRWCW